MKAVSEKTTCAIWHLSHDLNMSGTISLPYIEVINIIQDAVNEDLLNT